MNWESIDWEALNRLRSRYLESTGAGQDYWSSEELLASYDFTFAQRIGWKWDAVLRELRVRGWQPAAGTRVFDWGCGSGVAARAVIAEFGVENFSELQVWDKSALAMKFSERRARERFSSLKAGPGDPALATPDLLLVSHVLNELSEHDLGLLKLLIRRSKAVLWVEAGTSEVSRRLSEVREGLKKDFRILGPCTHAAACGMFASGNESHWCHSFATPPSEIFSDSGWVQFGKRLQIDLRSLPYCYLALERADIAATSPETSEFTRLIGEARHYKGYGKLLTCDGQHGVAEFILQKRDAPELLKKLKDLREPPFFKFERSENKIVSGKLA